MTIDSEEYSGISVFVGAHEVGLLIKDIQEIIEPVSTFPVPVTDSSLEGLISLRGSVLPVIALKLILHASQSPFTNKDKKYVICAADSKIAALDVDAVGDTFTFDSNQLSDSNYDDQTGIITKQVELSGKTLQILNVSELIQLTSGLNKTTREAIGYSLTN
ncbi:chemotaxis protein CheW [Sporolactobacillus laevolacticus]|uniref:Chemotaxis protein CheW n=1 Tax=Sporolactobacillus laevolacticus DSM 442 TaxID=1395513 RepID=V6IXD8_9BACL|nr:chemotaxis protein CheW [Sporolactobacillus laevolacticus]EST11955.1 chemotaxis protein CheW [Sporolactobacillus laevolacticus DSM 442]MDN3956699.1 chemotaxis protein CheW [Sporolactobacillus laevolacticus]